MFIDVMDSRQDTRCQAGYDAAPRPRVEVVDDLVRELGEEWEALPVLHTLLYPRAAPPITLPQRWYAPRSEQGEQTRVNGPELSKCRC